MTVSSGLSLDIHSFDSSSHSVNIHNCSVVLLNTLRRTLIMDIPSLSIDLITIYNNSSNMPNEMLCHRLGMIPLPFLQLKKECNCAIKCRECSITFTLEKRGMSDVKANDLNCDSLDTSVLKGTIAKLSNNQSIKLEGIAKNGTAKEHAKFQAVNLVSFIKVNEAFTGLKIELSQHREIHEVMEMAILAFLERVRRLKKEFEKIK